MLGSDTYKIVVLGAGKKGPVQFYVARVGKTSLTERFVKGVFSGHQISTINASFLPKTIKLVDGTLVTLNIWVTNTETI